MLEFQSAGMKGRRETVPGNLEKSQSNGDDEPEAKKQKTETLDADVVQMNVAFFRSHYPDVLSLPKSVLHSYATRNRRGLPVYETQQVDRLFRTVVSFDRKRYASSYWEKNKKFAEQGAALVCSLHLGLVDEAVVIKNGGILAENK